MLSEVVGGCGEVAGVPNDDGVDRQAQRRRPVELCLVASVGEAGLAAEEDGPGHGVGPFLAVEADQHPVAERPVVDVGPSRWRVLARRPSSWMAWWRRFWRCRFWSLETSTDGGTSPSANEADSRLRSSQCSTMRRWLMVRRRTPLRAR